MNKILRMNSLRVSLLPKSISATHNCPIIVPLRLFSVTSQKFDDEKKIPRKEQLRFKYPEKDRSNPVSVETSIAYMKSEAFKKGYGGELIWKLYRRNYKGVVPPKKTRKMCIRGDVVQTGSPCPICRDEYLIVSYKNLDLLKQFISPDTGEIISYTKTGVCQKQHENLLVAHLQAKDLGLITFDVPLRLYDYKEYKPE